MIYFISDTHFNHKNIIEYENRPFSSIQEMNAEMIRRWNKTVTNNDIVFHLGDVGLGSESTLKEIIPQLNGCKILIKGNHDRKSNQFFLDCGFQAIYHTYMFSYNGKQIFLSHTPESRPGQNQPYDLHLFGHIHSKVFPSSVYHNGACMCVERWGYQPIDIDTIISLCDFTPERNIVI